MMEQNIPLTNEGTPSRAPVERRSIELIDRAAIV